MPSLFSPSRTGGSLVDALPYWGFIRPGVVLTRFGELLFCANVKPKAVDGAAPDDLDNVTQSWQRFLGSVEPPHRIYVVFERRPMKVPEYVPGRGVSAGLGNLVQKKRSAFVHKTLSDLDIWLFFCYNPEFSTEVGADQYTWALEYLRSWVGRFQRVKPLTRYLQSVVDGGIDRARALWSTVAPIVDERTPLREVEGGEFASLLHRLVNFRQDGWVLGDNVPKYGLSLRLADSILAFERTYAIVDHRIIGLFSMALPPRKISANALARLYAQPWEFNAVLEWRPVWRDEVAKRIRAVQKHYNNLRWSFFSAMNESEGTDMAVEDAGAASAVRMLDRAQVELTTDGIPYGEAALSYAVVSETAEALNLKGAEITRAFVDLDAKVVRETFGQSAVWFQRMCGAVRRTLPRPVLVSSGQVACLAPVFASPYGPDDCKHLSAPVLATLKTRWSTAYRYDLFGGSDVGHTLVLGATGSGKSFLLNFLLLQSLQYNPKIVILDLGRSYKFITELVRGSYLEMNLDDATGAGAPNTGAADAPAEGADGAAAARTAADSVGRGLRPFQLPAGERTYTFLAQWVTRILAIGGYEVKEDDASDIRDRVIDIYTLDREDRTLGQLAKSLPAPMWPAMARWIGDGQWAGTFDGPPPSPEEMEGLNADWQVVDLAGAVNFPDWCAAALFFLFERLRLAMDDDESVDRLKIMVVDEGCGCSLPTPPS